MNDPIRLNVVNGPVTVGSIRLIGLTNSSSILIGDTDSMALYSFFDTPPESVTFGPIVPLPPLSEEGAE